MKRGLTMTNLIESFRKKFAKDILIEIEQDHPTHIPVEEMIAIVYEASEKIGTDSYIVLKHFQFTEEEIKAYVKKVRVSDA
jgi:ERCC4-related helicase